MKFKYYPEDDILVMQFTNKTVDDSFEVDTAILEVDKNHQPVSLEILHASEFLKKQTQALPVDVKHKLYTTPQA